MGVLESLYPDHTIWRARRQDGRPGLWMATRHRPVPEGCAATLAADTAQQLEQQLLEQARHALNAPDL
ncbi:hypothetical protein ACSNOI_34230 [Actinomadura kijaniata]|uniref:hypothetical protein n=1 Tax=Actinomadura kijaniata TaxID=46161 RepID=UPI003F19EF1D